MRGAQARLNSVPHVVEVWELNARSFVPVAKVRESRAIFRCKRISRGSRFILTSVGPKSKLLLPYLKHFISFINQSEPIS